MSQCFETDFFVFRITWLNELISSSPDDEDDVINILTVYCTHLTEKKQSKCSRFLFLSCHCGTVLILFDLRCIRHDRRR